MIRRWLSASESFHCFPLLPPPIQKTVLPMQTMQTLQYIQQNPSFMYCEARNRLSRRRPNVRETSRRLSHITGRTHNPQLAGSRGMVDGEKGSVCLFVLPVLTLSVTDHISSKQTISHLCSYRIKKTLFLHKILLKGRSVFLETFTVCMSRERNPQRSSEDELGLADINPLTPNNL
jgi:hypothetical protein